MGACRTLRGVGRCVVEAVPRAAACLAAVRWTRAARRRPAVALGQAASLAGRSVCERTRCRGSTGPRCLWHDPPGARQASAGRGRGHQERCGGGATCARRGGSAAGERHRCVRFTERQFPRARPAVAPRASLSFTDGSASWPGANFESLQSLTVHLRRAGLPFLAWGACAPSATVSEIETRLL